MPTFTLKGNLVYFAAYKNHIGLYPAPSGTERFNRELSVYRAAKSSVRFPLNKPIPLDLVGKIVKLRVNEKLEEDLHVERDSHGVSRDYLDRQSDHDRFFGNTRNHSAGDWRHGIGDWNGNEI
jgi:hypothetical protein